MDSDKDDNKHQSFNDPINWKSLGFFSSQDYLVYIFKKTEKITSALYLISGLLKDEEPLKWELRDRGIDLVSSSFTASSSLPGDKNAVIRSLFTAALETISLLNVAKISNLITDMNYKILVREIDQIIGMLKDRLAESAENAGYVLSESFFRTPDLFSSGFRPDAADMRARNAEQRTGNMDRSGGRSGQDTGSLKASQGQFGLQEKKTHRQDMILGLLRSQSNLTIKDFSKVIKDCSLKTIQRELLELVNKGLVKKEGKRRWSKYSIR